MLKNYPYWLWLASLLIVLFGPEIVYAQKVLVKQDEVEIDQLKRKGLSTTIELDRKTVEKAWQKKLKEWKNRFKKRYLYFEIGYRSCLFGKPFKHLFQN